MDNYFTAQKVVLKNEIGVFYTRNLEFIRLAWSLVSDYGTKAVKPLPENLAKFLKNFFQVKGTKTVFAVDNTKLFGVIESQYDSLVDIYKNYLTAANAPNPNEVDKKKKKASVQN